MNQEVGSIMGYLYKLYPVQVYEKEIPQDFVVPSLYIPPASTVDGVDTVSTFQKSYVLNVKLFHKNAQEAHNEAERIADTLRSKRGLIPLIRESGEDTGGVIRLSRIETRISDDYASIVLNWTSRYWYEREQHPSLENFEFTSGVK
ncbi:phage tail terminator family protein [Bacillus halotolerans]|uniref:phage tail terminator family protein n=1 Tax=Bacillus halotolerans TaxID=260554 RepID=UPI0016623E9C|nr:phage portal protein [Bacillus halotolerans]MBV7321644.1 phage portal protein [Halalkalibacterium halodurans]QNS20518.1 phage portal protein [Bacillus halotolerans]